MLLFVFSLLVLPAMMDISTKRQTTNMDISESTACVVVIINNNNIDVVVDVCIVYSYMNV